jgi:hypothetical protein
MAESEEPPFSKRKRGFFIETSVVDQKAVPARGGSFRFFHPSYQGGDTVAPENLKRKLTAILSADVQGYSRLMGEDEVGTIHTLKVYMEVITGFIQQHRGRVVATGEDSVLAGPKYSRKGDQPGLGRWGPSFPHFLEVVFPPRWAEWITTTVAETSTRPSIREATWCM